MMWHTGDYGLNPEHPPLVKLLATLPILGENLWLPPLTNREFKVEAYLNGRDWLARNDGDSQRLVFRMRLAAGLLAIGLSLVVFFAAREWFGDVAGLAALALVSFDPNIVGHSALVTTDIGVSLFFLASIYAFYRYVKRPTLLRLLLAEVAGGSQGPSSTPSLRSPVDAARDFIETHHHRGIGVSDVAAHAGLDASYLLKLFRAKTGKNLRDYLIAVRLERARLLLRENVLTVAQVAQSVGFHSYASFEKTFRRHLNLTPTEYRDSLFFG